MHSNYILLSADSAPQMTDLMSDNAFVDLMSDDAYVNLQEMGRVISHI